MRWLLPLIASLTLGVVLLADAGAMGPYLNRVHATPYGDKALHVLLASALTLAVGAALAARSAAPRRAVLRGALVVAAVLTVEEATNIFTPHRACSAGDLAANYAGVLLGSLAPLAAYAALHRGLALTRTRAAAPGSPDA